MRKQILSGCLSLTLSLFAADAFAASPAQYSKRDFSGTWTNQSLTRLSRPGDFQQLEVSREQAERYVKAQMTIGFTAEEKDKTHVDPNAGAPPAGDKDFGVKGYDPAWTSAGESFAVINGRYRTSHIVSPTNGQLPHRDPEKARSLAEARRVIYETGNGPYDGPEHANLSERCLIGFGGTGGPGMLNTLYNNNYNFVSTKDHLAIVVEMAHDVRLIPIFANQAQAQRSHRPDAIKPWLGDSVAWWESDTLVVETINVHPLQGAAGPFPLSEKAKVTERLTRTGEKEILYRFTVDDPVHYTHPWTAELAFRPSPGIFEYACHEGNYGLVNMLSGARLKDNAPSQASAAQ